MKRVGLAVIVVAALWLSVLVVTNVWVEPANIPTGDVTCGTIWRAVPTGEFHADAACHRAEINRRIVALMPTGVIVVVVAALALERRRKRRPEAS